MIYRTTLTYNSVDTVLPFEPKGLDSLQSVFKRDFDTFGVFFNFSNQDDLKLEFAGTGRTVLKSARDVYGFDAVVNILIESRPDVNTSYSTEFEGVAVMESLEINELYASVSFEEQNNILKYIRDSMDVPVDVQSTKDLLGNTITGLVGTDVSYPLINFDCVLSQDTGGTWGVYLQASNTFSYLTTNHFVSENSLKWINGDIPFIDTAADTGTTNQIIFGDTLRAPELGFSYGGSVTLDIDIESAAGSAGCNIVLYFDLKKDGVIVGTGTHTILSTIQSTTISLSDTFNVSNEDVNYTIESRCIVSAISSVNVNVTTSQWDWKMTSSYLSGAITVKSFNIYDAINKNIEIITGENNILVSDFLQTDLTTLYETSGYLIRDKNKNYEYSLSTRMESVNSMFCLGYGLEYDIYGQLNIVRIEKVEHFFQDVEMLEITDIEIDSYQETFSDDLLFNKAEIEYKDYSKDEPTGIVSSQSDYNTKAFYVVENLNLSGIYSKKIEAVTSPFLIMEARGLRERISAENETDPLDEKYFIQQTDGSLNILQNADFETENINSKFPFNLELNPRFILYNHALIINSALYKRDLTSVFKNQKYELSPTAKIGYTSGTALFKTGDTTEHASAATVLVQNADLNTGLLYGGDRLFEPVLIRFKSAMTAELFELIKLNHRSGAANNYGYISVTDPDGVNQQGWLLNLTYNIVDKIGEFELIKKAENYLP